MFTVFEENTVKLLEGSSDICVSLQKSSAVFENLLKYRELSKNGRNLLNILNKITLTFLESFLSLSGKYSDPQNMLHKFSGKWRGRVEFSRDRKVSHSVFSFWEEERRKTRERALYLWLVSYVIITYFT